MANESKNERHQKAQRLVMTIPEFAEEVGISRNLAYSLAATDTLPVPVIRIGPKRICVSRKAVEALLSGETEQKG